MCVFRRKRQHQTQMAILNINISMCVTDNNDRTYRRLKTLVQQNTPCKYMREIPENGLRLLYAVYRLQNVLNLPKSD